MLNSLSLQDLTLDLVVNMVKSNWRMLTYWVWNTGLPGLASVVGGIGCLFAAYPYLTSGRWYAVPLFFAAFIGGGALAGGAVYGLGRLVLRMIGRPHAFEGWDDEPENPPRGNTSIEPGDW